MNIEHIALLDVAEQISCPADGMRVQSIYAANLIVNGVVSTTSVDGLSPEQVHALRHASLIWPGFRIFCFCCRVELPHRQDRRQCSACKRSIYCGIVCQRK